MDSGLFPTSITAAVNTVVQHKHTFKLDLGSSTISFGREVGRTLVALTTIVCITGIVKAVITRPIAPATIAQSQPPKEKKSPKIATAPIEPAATPTLD